MYTLEQLSTMTGLTTRTLRNYLKAEVLQGDKTDGAWRFSEQQVQQFITHPSVQPSIQAKRNAIVYDFLLERPKMQNEACVMLDLNLEARQAEEVSSFFCEAAKDSKAFRFAFSYQGGAARFILKGTEPRIREILDAYSRRFGEN